MSITTAPAGAAATATFASGQVIVNGDSLDNNIVVSRTPGGAIRLNGGAIPIAGGSPTVLNTTLILLFGQEGNDVLGLDEANGSLPPAQMFGSVGNDTLTGGAGADLIFGQAGHDTVFGKFGDDWLVGGSESDTLTGGDGDDQVHGEADNDRLVWNPGDDTDLNEGGTGTDTVDVNGSGDAEEFAVAANGARIRVDRLTPAPSSIDAGAVEKVDVQANGGADEFSASGNLVGLVALVVDGGDGDDTLSGGNGNDVLIAGEGRDLIDANAGNDVAFLGGGEDRFQWDPGDGSDVVEGQDGVDRMTFNGDGASELFGVSANGGRVRFTRSVGNIVMDLNDVEGIDTVAKAGTDGVTVNDLYGTDLIDVEIDLVGSRGGGGDVQADDITVNATNGNDAITVTGAAGKASVKGLRPTVGVTGAEASRDRLTIDGLGGVDTVDASGLATDAIALILRDATLG